MKFLILFTLASTCLAITPDVPAAGESPAKRNAVPETLAKGGSAAVCHPAICSTKSVCKSYCHGGTCHKTQAGPPHFWQCRCHRDADAEDDLSKRITESEPESASLEDLTERSTGLEPEADPIDSEDAPLEIRAVIEARARCVPGSYGKKKKSCTPHCKGRGRCQRASSPGVGFIWTCNCP